MLSIDTKIDRAQRLLRMLEQDTPYLAHRVAELTPEHQKLAKDHAAALTATTRAELARLMEERPMWDPNDPTPQAAD